MALKSSPSAITALIIIGGLTAGCATEGPPPVEEVTRAQSVIDQADKAGVQRFAAADLQRAHDELNDAERANGAGKYTEARREAESAEVDADLATARASEGAALQAAREVVQGNETLRQESARGAISATPAAN
jgi:hypothetical protein